MRVILVEDEAHARRQLAAHLRQILPEIEIAAELETVRDAVRWIEAHPAPDLAFFDIQLADDTSFAIFEQAKVDFPVVFVTAFDDYLLKAFEYNSIHYLLKPISREKVAGALKKARALEDHFLRTGFRELISRKTGSQPAPERLIVRKGLDFVPLSVAEIAYCFSEHKVTFARDFGGETYIVDPSLTELEGILGDSLFFRANRQFLVRKNAIKKYKSVDQSKIELDLMPPPGKPVVIGKENASVFRKWIAM